MHLPKHVPPKTWIFLPNTIRWKKTPFHRKRLEVDFFEWFFGKGEVMGWWGNEHSQFGVAFETKQTPSGREGRKTSCFSPFFGDFWNFPRSGVTIWHQPKQCMILREIPRNYHTFVLFDSLEMGNLWKFSDAWSLEITLFQALWFVLVPARLWGWYWSPPHRVCSMPSLVVSQQLAIQKGLIHENDTVPGRWWFLVMLDTKQTLKHQRPSSQQMVGSHDLSYECNVAESPIYSSLTILTLEKSINQMKRATKSPTFSTLMASTPSLGTTNLIGMISCGTTGKIWRGGGCFGTKPHTTPNSQ